MKVVYFDVESYEEEYIKENSHDFEFYLEPEPLNEISEIKAEYKDADIISVFTTSRVTSNVLMQFPKLKLIALRSVGFNHVDLEYCKRHDIAVVNSPNYGNVTVAEFALALLMNTARKITKSYSEFKVGKVSPKSLVGVELYNKTVGIVGLGAIGAYFAELMHGLNLNVLGFDRYEKTELKEKFNVQYVDFDTLLEKSDFISIHAPLTKETYHLFDEKCFRKMKNSAIIINTGRGEIIDTKALYNALQSEEIAGAGLDVLESEETMTDDDYMISISRLDKLTLERTIINSRLFQLENVVLTPHTAYNTKEAIQRILSTTLKNIKMFIKGEPPTNQVF